MDCDDYTKFSREWHACKALNRLSEVIEHLTDLETSTPNTDQRRALNEVVQDAQDLANDIPHPNRLDT